MDYPGNLFVVAAPSGSGKSSLVNALMEVDERVAQSISYTTRPPRGQEKDGREYHFVDRATFDRMIAAAEFLEWAEVHGHRYGTSRSAIEQRMQNGGDVVLEIDWQGALQIRKLFGNAVLVFVLPPNWDELRARLERRGEDSGEEIALRLANAREEFRHVDQFNYVIINEIFERALFDLKAIVHAERLRYSAQRRNRADAFEALEIN